MACCLLCFSDEPLEGDPKALRANKFQLSMMEACCTPFCCLTYLCPPCVAYYSRYRSLNYDMKSYQCCQGYLNLPCCHAGSFGESTCPECCLCLEAFCCLGPSMSSTRMLLMDQYDLQPDPCDNQLIRFNNCMMIFSCLCDILAAIDENFRQCSQMIDCVTNTIFYCTIGCMGGQIYKELEYREQQRAFSEPVQTTATSYQPKALI